MLRVILSFFIFISVLLLLLVYFAGDYHVNPDFIQLQILRRDQPVRNVVFDSAIKGKTDSYSLKITSAGEVTFNKNDQGERDFRNFKIETHDLETIQDKMNTTGVFKVVSLDRTYCFDRYEGVISFDYGWVNKNIKYSNCPDDPSEIRDFRTFLYTYLGLSLKGI